MTTKPIFDTPPTTLAIVRLSAIGDTVHTVPIVRAIQDAWPQTRIVWIIGRTEHGLLAGLEDVEFVVFDKSRGWRAYLDVRHALAGRSFPLLLHMHASARANLASLMVRADVRLGFDRARARDMQWIFCNRHIAAVPQQHVMDGLFEFPKALGIERGPLRWDIPVSEQDRLFAARHIADGEPALIISPCTGQRFRNYRNWSTDRYSAVADYAYYRYGAKVLLTGGTTSLEREYGTAIAGRSVARPVDLIGRTTLKQLLALLARASVVVCPDSGPAHMAVSVGTPVVGLYATSNRLRTGPYLSQHLVVDRYPEAVRRELGREVGELRWGARVRNPETMSLITVDEVTAKLDEAFRGQGIAAVA